MHTGDELHLGTLRGKKLMLVFVKQKSKTKHDSGDNDKNMERWAV